MDVHSLVIDNSFTIEIYWLLDRVVGNVAAVRVEKNTRMSKIVSVID